MTPTALSWLSLFGFGLSALGATGTRLLHAFGRRELEHYCRRRRDQERFREIIGRHDQVALGAETLQLLGVATMIIAGAFWFVGYWNEPSALSVRLFVSMLLIHVVLLLMATVWLPVTLVKLWSAPFIYHTWWMWKLASMFVWPMSACGRVVDELMRRLAGRSNDDEPDQEQAFEDEIRTIMTAGLRHGLLEDDARDMIEGVIVLGDAAVSDIMTPRSDVDWINVAQPWNEVLDLVKTTGRTRLPVYENSRDNVLGILYVKDLLPILSDRNVADLPDLRSLLRTAISVPQTKPVDDLLRDFLGARSHISIVLDEYRAVAGVVTIEDALEEIVGEIVDESDDEVVEDIRQINGTTIEATGRAHLDDLNEDYGLDFPDPDDYDTIGGLVISHFGYVPKAGEVLEVDGVRITVIEAIKRRVESVHIEILSDAKREPV